MKLQATARVDADARLDTPIRIEDKRYTLELGRGSDGRFTRLRVCKTVADYLESVPVANLTPTLKSIDLRGGVHISDLVALLQHVESIGSFFCGIRRVYWQDCEFEWIAESGEEAASITVGPFKTSYGWPQSHLAIGPTNASQLLALREKRAPIVLPMAFFREGMNEFYSYRFLYAFLNFYLFLDDTCGEGKTKNASVLRAFRRNNELVEAVAATLIELQQPSLEHHRAALESFFAAENCEWTAEGSLQLIVNMRGNLFHFSQRSSKRKGHPLNQAEVESLAYLLMGICLKLLPTLLFSGTRRATSGD